MRCLVVNAYSNTRLAADHFHRSLAVFREVAERHCKGTTVVVCECDELHQYVPPKDSNPDNEVKRNTCLAAFDRIDLIFIDGDEGLLPWLPEGRQLYLLVRMALQMGKCLFSTIGGTTALCAANATGGADVSQAVDIQALPSQKTTGMVLDTKSGDVYKADGEVLTPYMNVGVHARAGCIIMGRSAMKAAPASRFTGHVRMRPCPKYVQHWLFSNMQTRHFDLHTSLAYDISLDGRPDSNGLDVLAQDSGPSGVGVLVIQVGNCIGLRFAMTEREGGVLLNNFFRVHHDRISRVSHTDLSAQFAHQEDVECNMQLVTPRPTNAPPEEKGCPTGIDKQWMNQVLPIVAGQGEITQYKPTGLGPSFAPSSTRSIRIADLPRTASRPNQQRRPQTARNESLRDTDRGRHRTPGMRAEGDSKRLEVKPAVSRPHTARARATTALTAGSRAVSSRASRDSSDLALSEFGYEGLMAEEDTPQVAPRRQLSAGGPPKKRHPSGHIARDTPRQYIHVAQHKPFCNNNAVENRWNRPGGDASVWSRTTSVFRGPYGGSHGPLSKETAAREWQAQRLARGSRNCHKGEWRLPIKPKKAVVWEQTESMARAEDAGLDKYPEGVVNPHHAANYIATAPHLPPNEPTPKFYLNFDAEKDMSVGMSEKWLADKPTKLLRIGIRVAVAAKKWRTQALAEG